MALQIRGLTLTQRQEERTLVRDFDLVLNPGDRAVIVGEEGNGKSSLLRWIYDPALIESYMDHSGSCDRASHRLGYLPQELPAREKGMPACEFFGESEAFWNTDPGALRALSRSLGLPADIYYSDRILSTFSGGEKVKLQMARLLLSEPDVLLLDEPSNDIDIETLEWLEELILRQKGIVLFISHDETLIENTANRVILLEQLRRKTLCRSTVANMPFRQFMAERRAGFEKQAQLAFSERREEKKALEKFRRIQQRVENEQNKLTRQDPHSGRLLKKKMASVKAMERRYEREHEELTAFPEYESAISVRFDRQRPLPAGKTVVELSLPELRAADGERVLARDLKLELRGPQKLCIVGKNGAGKTTLLRLIREDLEKREDLRVCYMPQDYEELLALDEDPVSFLAPSGEKEEVTFVRACLGAMRYTTDEMSHPIRALSGGQKAKVLLLKMSLSEANVLLLDEPTRNFSPLSGPEIRAMLRSFPGAILSVSHDRKFIGEVCDRVLRLTEEGLVEEKQ